MTTPQPQRDLAELVSRTINALDNARLPLDLPGTMQLNESRKRLRTQLATRIRPHLLTDGLPTVVVLGGSSGAGKSTLFNSLMRGDLSPASVLRPTTRTPVIAIHPDDEALMRGHALCSLGKVVYTAEAIPGMVLVDAPDLDSIDAGNRELSRRLVDAADLWLFVTTASRYGDATAWTMLTEAHARGMTTAVVLNRVPLRSLKAIRADLMQRMEQIGMGEDPLLVVPDAGPHEERLDPHTVAELHDWLSVIAATRVGQALVDRTSKAMLPELRAQLVELSEAVEMQANAVQDLRDRAYEAAVAPASKVATNARNGRYGQGAPTTAWLTFASTGGALAGLVTGKRPGLRSKLSQRDAAARTIFDGVVNAVRVGISQAVATARSQIEDAWSRDIADTSAYREEGAKRINDEEIITAAIDGWREDLLSLVGKPPKNSWLSETGSAAILGSAAGGIAGAEKALHSLGMGSLLRDAREALAVRLEDAIAAVSQGYASVLDDIAVGNGRELRLRASEYLDRT